MSISFEELVESQPSDVTVQLDETRTIKLTYDRASYTAEVEDEFKKTIDDKQRPTGAMAELLRDMIIKWDIKGQPKPTLELLKKVPVATLSKIITAIMEDMNPGEGSSGS